MKALSGSALSVTVALVTAGAGTGCGGEGNTDELGRLHLSARAPAGQAGAGYAGTVQPLGLSTDRDGVVYVPSSYTGDRMPLELLLHGAGANGRDLVPLFNESADREGFLILAPDSRARTWDAIHGELGPDVAFIESALNEVLANFAIDPRRLSLAGFSDGASYALTLGTTNGDLFPHIMAFSPCRARTLTPRGRPSIFVSHGTRDEVLVIDHCSRALVPKLKANGYNVAYEEFDGGHTVPPEIAQKAIQWWAGD